jgi:hypothetical protein
LRGRAGRVVEPAYLAELAAPLGAALGALITRRASPATPADSDPVAADTGLLGAPSIRMPQVSQKSVAVDWWPSGHTAMEIAAISWF